MNPNQSPVNPNHGGADVNPIPSSPSPPPGYTPQQPYQQAPQAPQTGWQQPSYPAAPQPQYQPYPPQPGQAAIATDDDQKDFVMAFLLSWLLGVFGADRFYLGYTGLGIAKLLTLGGLGFWALIDVALLAFGKIKDKDGLPLKGYAKNKNWVRALAIVHLVIFAAVLIFYVVIFAFAASGEH